MYRQSQRVEYLDSIRGIASLFVLLAHMSGALMMPAWIYVITGAPFVSVFFNGKEAVAMFFVLSGYVLSKPYIPTAFSDAPVRNVFLPTFYLRRFTRIWLPWFAIFCVSIFAQRFLFITPPTRPPISPWLNQFWHAPLTTGDFFRQCAFMLHDPPRQLLNQDWSLGVELKGSLLIPIFLVLSRPQWVWALFISAGMLLVFVGTGQYYFSFIIGVFLARNEVRLVSMMLRWSKPGRAGFLILSLLLYQGLGFVTYVFDDMWDGTYKYGWVISALGCGLLLVYTFASQSAQRILNHGTITFLGRISYSIYLLQFVVILCLFPRLVVALNHWGIVQAPLVFILTILAGAGTTIASAAVVHRFVEVPSINLGHQLTKLIQRRIER